MKMICQKKKTKNSFVVENKKKKMVETTKSCLFVKMNNEMWNFGLLVRARKNDAHEFFFVCVYQQYIID